MAESTEAPFSVSFKTGKSTLITVRGESAADWVARLAAASEAVTTPDGPVSALDMIRDIESVLALAPLGATTTGVPQGGQGQAQQSLTPPCKTCGGTTMEKTGNGKRGPWKGYFCTVNKDHSPDWVS